MLPKNQISPDGKVNVILRKALQLGACGLVILYDKY